MKIKTTRFDEIDIDEQAIITVPGGLIGFAQQERFIIIEHSPESPFFWFQSVDRSDLAFVIVNPLLFKADYEITLSPSLLEEMSIQKPEDTAIYVIATIPQGKPQEMTANLMGPLVININKQIARQIIIDDERYSQRYPIIASGE